MATVTWVAASAGNASTDANWSGGVKPATGDDVVFDGTSVNNCSWDIDAATVTVGSISIASGYTGTITQAATADIGIGAGGFSMAGGTATFEPTKNVRCAGDVTHTGGTLTTSKLALVMSTDGKTVTLATDNIIASLTANGNTNAVRSGSGSFIVGTLITASGKALTIADGTVLKKYASSTLTNAGSIGGTGTFYIAVNGTQSLTFGAVTAPTIIALVTGSASKTFTLGANTVLSSTLTVRSDDAAGILTVEMNGKSLSCSALTVSTRGVLTNSGAEADCLVSGAFTLSGASSVVSGAVKLACGSYVQSDGLFTQVSDISIGSGGASISGGTFTGLETKTVTLNGGAWNKTGGTVTSYKVNLVTTGVCSFADNIASGYYRLSNTGTLTALVAGYANNLAYIVENSGTLLIPSGKTLNVYYIAFVANLSNTGHIGGEGTLGLYLRNYGANFSPGDITCNVKVYVHSSSAESRVCTLISDPTSRMASLTVLSDHASNTCTLDLAGRSLSANGITIGTRGVVLGGEGVVRNLGSFDSSAGTWTPETCQYIQLGNGTVKLAAGQTFYDYLNAPNTVVTRGSDVTVSHEYGNGGIVIPGAYSLTASGTSYDLMKLPLEMKVVLSPIIHPNGKRFMRKMERVL